MTLLPDRTTDNLLGLMLKPVVRFCLRNGLTVQRLVEMAKQIFVELSVDDIAHGRSKVTVSKLSVMTGIHRAEVSRIYREGRKTEGRPNLLAQVFGQWENDLEFRTPSGKPRALTYGSVSSEFTKLVEKVNKDVNAATVLYELERRGAIKKTDERVSMLETLQYHHQTPDRGLEMLSRDTATLITAAQENLFQPQDTRNLHIRTEYDNVFREDLPYIRGWILEKGKQFHKEIREFLSGYDRDVTAAAGKDGGARVVVGAFSWTQRDGEEKTV